ncbi:MAG: YbfB/YjiJ family MFS transporter [Burkholderiaceae bacterium]
MIGLARFSYGLMLPSMQATCTGPTPEAGGLGAANALGYLAGAIITMRSVQRLGNRGVLFAGGLAVTAIAMLASGLDPGVWLATGLAGTGWPGVAGTFVRGGYWPAPEPGPRGTDQAGARGHGVLTAVGGVLLGATLPLCLPRGAMRPGRIAWIAMGGDAAGHGLRDAGGSPGGRTQRGEHGADGEQSARPRTG